jgi:hypothetical protein
MWPPSIVWGLTGQCFVITPRQVKARCRWARLTRQEREQRLVDPGAAGHGHRPHDALPGEARPLENPLGRDVADVHVRGDPHHPERERVLGQQPREARRDPAPARVRKDPVADLDDRALRVEVVQRAATDALAGARVDRDQRQQPAARGEGGQLREHREHLPTVEVRKVAGLAQLGVRERGQQGIDVVHDRHAQQHRPVRDPRSG